MIDIVIKKVTRATKKTDAFLRRDVPLAAVVKLHPKKHNHSTECADALRRLRSTEETKDTFYKYFCDGITPAEAVRLHESKVTMQEDGWVLLANASVNPPPRRVYHWYDEWRKAHYGMAVDPLKKLQEKIPDYAKHGNFNCPVYIFSNITTRSAVCKQVCVDSPGAPTKCNCTEEWVAVYKIPQQETPLLGKELV